MMEMKRFKRWMGVCALVLAAGCGPMEAEEPAQEQERDVTASGPIDCTSRCGSALVKALKQCGAPTVPDDPVFDACISNAVNGHLRCLARCGL